MSYAEQRDAILTHAVAAAASVNPHFTNVAIGAPIPKGKCVRIFWTGEAEPTHMGPSSRTLNSKMVAPTCGLVGFWPMSSLTDAAAKAIDDEMVAFVHALRTAVLADSQLGGKATDLEMGFASPNIVVTDGGRFATVEVDFTFDYLEYPLAP